MNWHIGPNLPDYVDSAFFSTAITDNLTAARSESFGYDALRRLSDATGPYGDVDYAYDPVGNRTGRTTDDGLLAITDSYTYELVSNRLSWVSDGSTMRSLIHDAAGAVVADDRGTGTALDLGHNAENRLVSVMQGTTTLASYLHNALGERVAKTAGAVTTHYHYDQDGRLIAESDGLGTVQREYLYLGDLPLAVVDHTAAGGPALYHVHADHLGTPRLMTDATKAVVWDAVFKPFGGAHSLTGPAANDNRFPGQRADAVTGFHYNYFRDYDPTTGRYIQSDPIGLEGGNNLFSYVNASPVAFIDPKGLERKPGKTPNRLWPNPPENVVGKKAKWSKEGYWKGKNGRRITWDDRSHGAGIDRGEGPQGGHWDDETSNNRWDRYGNPLPGSDEYDPQNNNQEFCPLPPWAVGGAVAAGAILCILFPEVCLPAIVMGGAAGAAAQ